MLKGNFTVHIQSMIWMKLKDKSRVCRIWKSDTLIHCNSFIKTWFDLIFIFLECTLLRLLFLTVIRKLYFPLVPSLNNFPRNEVEIIREHVFNPMAINYNTRYSSPFSEISSVRGALKKICRCWSRLQRNYYPSSRMIHWQVRWIYWYTLLSNKFKCYPFSQFLFYIYIGIYT